MSGDTPARVIHVMPLRDAREHVPSSWCWCVPTLAPADDDDPDAPPIYVHDAADPGGIWACKIADEGPIDD